MDSKIPPKSPDPVAARQLRYHGPVALLVNTSTGQRIMLPARAILGRSSSCTLTFDDPCVSAEHATIAWSQRGWSIRDLGSRNGTFVNGQRLDAGEVPLYAGHTIAFGDPNHPWRLEDDSMPQACARDCKSNLLLFGHHGLLVLPEPQRPLVSVFCDPRHGWIAEVQGDPRPVSDGDMLVEAGHAWQLHLPKPQDQTAEFKSEQVLLEMLAFHFRLTDSGGVIELTILHGDNMIFRANRVFNKMLLNLSKQMLMDAQKQPEDRGWVQVDDLCKALSIDDNRLSVDIHRIRRELASLDVVNAANIIERRRATRQVRIGSENLRLIDSRPN